MTDGELDMSMHASVSASEAWDRGIHLYEGVTSTN
jgi:hypothetical protein